MLSYNQILGDSIRANVARDLAEQGIPYQGPPYVDWSGQNKDLLKTQIEAASGRHTGGRMDTYEYSGAELSPFDPDYSKKLRAQMKADAAAKEAATGELSPFDPNYSEKLRAKIRDDAAAKAAAKGELSPFDPNFGDKLSAQIKEKVRIETEKARAENLAKYNAIMSSVAQGTGHVTPLGECFSVHANGTGMIKCPGSMIMNKTPANDSCSAHLNGQYYWWRCSGGVTGIEAINMLNSEYQAASGQFVFLMI